MIQVKESESQSTFSSDNPLIDPANDMLGYVPFSRLLAQSISRICPKQGIVIAINGQWGSGKSTILNFVLYPTFRTFISNINNFQTYFDLQIES